jgi:2-oxoglutarate/2-oxoacid ferredoxin oxidoreductase subunit beta
LVGRPAISVVFAGSGGAGAMTAGIVLLRAAALIVEGMRWLGFAFIEVLSPCVTFRPEQAGWKKKVRHDVLSLEPDRAAATALALADDGFGLGVLFRGERAPAAPAAGRPQIEVADIEREFALA